MCDSDGLRRAGRVMRSSVEAPRQMVDQLYMILEIAHMLPRLFFHLITLIFFRPASCFAGRGLDQSYTTLSFFFLSSSLGQPSDTPERMPTMSRLMTATNFVGAALDYWLLVSHQNTNILCLQHWETDRRSRCTQSDADVLQISMRKRRCPLSCSLRQHGCIVRNDCFSPGSRREWSTALCRTPGMQEEFLR
jgi:hypothetical protein